MPTEKPTPRFPIIFFDLDGTLIGESGDVASLIWKILDLQRSRGTRMAVCTGRCSMGVALRVAQRLDPTIPHIFHSGAMVACADGSVLRVNDLHQQALTTLAEAAKELDLTIEFYTADEIFVNRKDEMCREHARVLELEVTEADLLEVADREEVIRAHWMFEPDRKDDVASVDPPGCEIAFASSTALPGMAFASVTKEGISKGSAAKYVCAELGVDISSAAGIGDTTGDIPLLDAVGHAFVMGDATDAELSGYTSVGNVADYGALDIFK